ncbi:MAG: hypothetical protein ACREQ5_07075 [Candidatus Dormibacteria bacterium]
MGKVYHVIDGAAITIRDLRRLTNFERATTPYQGCTLPFEEYEMNHNTTFDNGHASYVFVQDSNKYIVAQ